MAIRAGFAEIEITPRPGTHKIGWIKDVVITEIGAPLFARVAAFEFGDQRLAFVQLDTLCVRWTTTQEIRRRLEVRCRFPARGVMISATHNHAGPAVARVGDVPRDDAYLEFMSDNVIDCFGQALGNMRDVEIGFAHTPEWRLSHNRRLVMRDGTVQTHGPFRSPEALYPEGPVDPEVAVLAVRSVEGAMLGSLVNFACHPTHHGDDGVASGGFPGALAREMKQRSSPVTLFLNGACGNISAGDPVRRVELTLHDMGQLLAEDVGAMLRDLRFTRDLTFAARSRTIQLPYRAVTPEEVAGTVRGAQRFVDPSAYDRAMPALLKRIEERKTQPAEVQVLSIGDWDYVGIPGEYFVQLGLRTKERAYPRHALIVSCANGQVGYIPHRDAFARGGYETTFAPSSRLAPEAGDMLADTALALIAEDPS